MELLPDFDALLRWFRAAELLSPRETSVLALRWRNSSKARQVHKDMLMLRENLRSEILRWEADRSIRPSTIGQLNSLLAEHPMLTRLKPAGLTPGTELYFDTKRPGDLVAPLAHAAAALFATADPARVRKCRHCVLHFQDRSKKGTRQWCSMNLCGNRIKVAAYAARKRRALS
jgi:predicted RNA-binding Zn ribbon-like protein